MISQPSSKGVYGFFKQGLSSVSHFFSVRPKTRFLVGFLVFSILFFLLWTQVGRYYLIGVAVIAKFFLGFLGYDVVLSLDDPITFLYGGNIIGLEGAELVNFSLVPFLALVFATPRISRRRILVALGVGLSILFFFHVGDLVVHFPYFQGDPFARAIVSFAGVSGCPPHPDAAQQELHPPNMLISSLSSRLLHGYDLLSGDNPNFFMV